MDPVEESPDIPAMLSSSSPGDVREASVSVGGKAKCIAFETSNVRESSCHRSREVHKRGTQERYKRGEIPAPSF